MTLRHVVAILFTVVPVACGSPAAPSQNSALPLQAGIYELSIGAYPALEPLLLGTSVACPGASTDVSFSIRLNLQRDGASWVGVPVDATAGTVRVVLNPWDGSYSESGVTRGFRSYTGTVSGVMQQVVLSRVITTATFGGGQASVPLTGAMLGFLPQTLGTVGGTVAFSPATSSSFTCGPGQTNLSLRLVA